MSEPITKELREYALQAVKRDDYMVGLSYDLDRIADRIDAEHKRRMDDCRRNSNRHVVRYIRGVLTDYDRGVKRVRKGTATEVVRCKDCQWARRMDDRFVCTVRPTLAHLVDADEYCSRGVRADDEPPMSEAAKRVYDRLMDASAGTEEDDGR